MNAGHVVLVLASCHCKNAWEIHFVREKVYFDSWFRRFGLESCSPVALDLWQHRGNTCQRRLLTSPQLKSKNKREENSGVPIYPPRVGPLWPNHSCPLSCMAHTWRILLSRNSKAIDFATLFIMQFWKLE
jgi:hypothetical protein